jgi:hypothetical protein
VGCAWQVHHGGEGWAVVCRVSYSTPLRVLHLWVVTKTNQTSSFCPNTQSRRVEAVDALNMANHGNRHLRHRHLGTVHCTPRSEIKNTPKQNEDLSLSAYDNNDGGNDNGN